MGCVYGLQGRRTLDSLRHKLTICLYAWVRGNLEKVIEGFEGFRVPSELKQRLAEEKTPDWVLRLASQMLFGPLERGFGLPALQ